jgi:hypothetical protein
VEVSLEASFLLRGAFPESVISQRARSSPSIPEQLLVSILTLILRARKRKISGKNILLNLKLSLTAREVELAIARVIHLSYER